MYVECWIDPFLILGDVCEQVALRGEGQFFAVAGLLRDGSCLAVPVERFPDDSFHRSSEFAPLTVVHRTPPQQSYRHLGRETMGSGSRQQFRNCRAASWCTGPGRGARACLVASLYATSSG